MRRRLKKEEIRKGIYILPNLLTTANIFCGFLSIIKSMEQEYLFAAWILVLGAFFDFLDGRVARLTHTQSAFGIEYDSLSDLTSFGMAPAILIYNFALSGFGRLGWSVAFLFFACGALRLARYNVQSQSVERKNFQGLPIPCAAALPVCYVIFHNQIIGPEPIESYLALAMTMAVALLMVSNIPYWSFKAMDKGKKGNFFLLVLLVASIVIIASAPQIMLFVAAVTYVSAGIVAELLRSPQRIASFAEFMKRYFQADPNDLIMDDHKNERKRSLKVVGLSEKRSNDIEKE